MKTLLNPPDAEDMLRRIHLLRADTRPLWGKMSPAQMLTHCQISLRLASGELRLKRKLIGILFGGLARKQLTADKPFKHNLPTAKEFRVSDPRDFALEKANLIARIQQFQQGGAKGITQDPHPFFGRLSVAEWETLQWKHVDHHMRQFGV